MRAEAAIERVDAAAYRIATDLPEADGTYAWTSTTLVTVQARAGGERGFGYTYGSAAGVALIRDQLAPRVIGLDALAVEDAWAAMGREVRNVGRPGIAATAISAIDSALWDLKAKLLGLPLFRLLGEVRSAVPVYGSGGFTSYSQEQLRDQLRRWVSSGIRRVKMKVGTDPSADPSRVAAAREAIGRDAELMVDANGAYRAQQALGLAESFARSGVNWFEEPVSSDDLEGLRFVRQGSPAGMDVTAGEYGYDLGYFRKMLQAGAVDVLQADATRCLGVTGFMGVGRLCEAFGVALSAHTAPSIHMHVGCAVSPLIHVEYFHDHARIEQLLFEGCISPKGGALQPDRSRPGLGVELKRADAEKFAIAGESWASNRA